MKFIYKYPITVADKQVILMPVGSRVLYLATQRDIPCIWALVDPKQPPIPRTLLMYGTGHPIKDEDAEIMNYIGTFMMAEGALVFHLFER